MAWLPDGTSVSSDLKALYKSVIICIIIIIIKNFEDIFIHFGATHERDGRTDRQTDTG